MCGIPPEVSCLLSDTKVKNIQLSYFSVFESVYDNSQKIMKSSEPLYV